MGLKFEPEAINAIKIMEKSNNCLYLTGKAGSGKSTLINYYIKNTKKRYILLGTTGVSAEMIGGMTIHKFFNLKPGKNRSWFSAMNSNLIDLIKSIDIFIIDEVSMMRADLFDLIEKLMKRVMDNDEFMGGKQFIFVGDLFQLPPVPENKFLDREKQKENLAFNRYNEKYNGLFFFDGKNYGKDFFKTIQLRKVYRQEDQTFVNMLNLVRDGFSTPDIIKYFNQKLIKKEEIHPKSILISSTNQIAYNYNKKKLEELPGKTINSKAFISGEYPEEFYPNDLWINYKKGARVMFTVNHKHGYYVNGTLGTVAEIYQNSVSIIKDNGESIEVGRNQWMNTDGANKDGTPIILGTFTQFPFKCAFAITIHKSQGKSFDNVVIDLGRGAFTAGQVYVAFSRARSFEGLQLLKPLKAKDVFADKNVINFLKKTTN